MAIMSGQAEKQDRQQAAERWNRRYRASECVFGRAPADFLRRRIEELGAGDDALDLAMGEGRNALFLAERGYRVTGVDVSLAAVQRARALAAERGLALRAVVADLGQFPLARHRWSLIVNVRFLDRGLLRRVGGLLRPGGVLLMENFSIDHPLEADFGPSDPERLLRPNEALSLLSDLRVEYYEDRVFDDDGRRAALVRLIARKAK
jgi:SAM-dependent methyltransferase